MSKDSKIIRSLIAAFHTHIEHVCVCKYAPYSLRLHLALVKKKYIIYFRNLCAKACSGNDHEYEEMRERVMKMLKGSAEEEVNSLLYSTGRSKIEEINRRF